jgi:mono/diheme cytochrome c family protein
MNIHKLLLVTTVAGLALTFAAQAGDVTLPPASDKKDVTYATDIKPIFETSCVKCHSGEKPKARLHMDTLEGVLKGTKMGPILKAGDSANSFIIKAVTHATSDHDSWMPPEKNRAGIKPLTPAQIGLIRAWIDQGAK